ncbi:hypothetical protein [Methanomethylovorans sp.]|uniref:hypothetical protein n=1 Tax=Methanomethylovorans sp. TaxID=2758717 RepID=UPI00345E29EA
MNRRIKIPMTEDILSLKTLMKLGLTNPQIIEYYSKHGIEMSQRTLMYRIKELREILRLESTTRNTGLRCRRER